MLAYAAGRPRIAARQSSPNAMLVVLCTHIVVIAAVMSAKMDLPHRIFDHPTVVTSIPLPKEPLPVPLPTGKVPHSTQSSTTHQTENTTAVQPQLPIETGGDVAGPTGGEGTLTIPTDPLPPKPVIATTGARLLTSASELKPPYPRSKILAEEEAALNLRLTIDASGRVVAVDPIGRVDPVFLDAARRHLLTHWRYKPAAEDGRPITSTVVITLRFQLDG